MKSLDFFIDRGATFSVDSVYRYKLWRLWDKKLPFVLFIMLNPSTANEDVNDPTVERCERRAKVWGYGGVVVVNLFAFRATDPKVMKAAADPVGPINDWTIVGAARMAGLVVCAWGQHGAHRGRASEVVAQLRREGVALHALKVTTGEPWHPLYVPYEAKPFLWRPA